MPFLPTWAMLSQKILKEGTVQSGGWGEGGLGWGRGCEDGDEGTGLRVWRAGWMRLFSPWGGQEEA